MAKVIDLTDRKKVKEDLSKGDKLRGLQSLFRCAHCGARCAKCGAHGEATQHITHTGSGVSFRLCQMCLEEYQDLLAYLEADPKPEVPFWFNREWIRQWLAWLDYQWALANYVSSPEVLQVLKELED